MMPGQSRDLEKAEPDERSRSSWLSPFASELLGMICKLLSGIILLALVVFAAVVFYYRRGSPDDLRWYPLTEYHSLKEMVFFVELCRFAIFAALFWISYSISQITGLCAPVIVASLSRQGVQLVVPGVTRSLEYIATTSRYVAEMIGAGTIWIVGIELLPYSLLLPAAQQPGGGVSWTLQPWQYYSERALLLHFFYAIYKMVEKSILHIIELDYHKTAYQERAFRCIYGLWVVQALERALNGSKVMRKRSFPYKPSDLLWVSLKANLIGSNEPEPQLDLEALGHKLYAFLNRRQRNCLQSIDFRPLFSDAEKAFHALDIGENGDITEPELVHSLIVLTNERAGLIQALTSHRSIIKKLDRFLMAFVYIAVVFTFFTVFDYSPQKALIPLGVSLTPTIVALTVIFGETIKSLFAALVFIFATHPFDIGDRVYMDGGNFFVSRIDLFSTTFRRFDGILVYEPNYLLANKSICNVRRTGRQAHRFDISVWSGTPSEKLDQLRSSIIDFVKTESRDFSAIIACTWEISNCNEIVLAVLLRHKYNFQEGWSKATRQNRFLQHIQWLMEEKLQIKYTPPVRLVEMLPPEE